MENVKSNMTDMAFAVSEERDSFGNSFKRNEELMTEKFFALVERLEIKCEELYPFEDVDGILDDAVQARGGFLGFIKMHQDSREKIIRRLEDVVFRLNDLI